MKACRICIGVLAAVAVFVFGLDRSQGQNALGGGDLLDRNLSATGGIQNQPRSTQNFRDRNLLVTGDVVGGRGFRGSVGYTAAEDFRGQLASDDLFDFRAGSALSNPQLIGLGTTYQQMRFGQEIGLVEYRRSFSGDAASVNAQDPLALDLRPGQVNQAARLRLDRTALASSSELAQELSAEPNVVGYTFNEQNQPILFNASTTRGLTMEAMNQSVGTIGLSSLDAARIRQDIEAGGMVPNLGAEFQTPFGAPAGLDLTPGRAPVPGESAPPNLLQSSVGPDYNRILNRVLDRYASVSDDLVDTEVGTEVSSKLNKEYNALRDQLAQPRGRELDPRQQAVARSREERPGDAAPGRQTLLPGPDDRDDRRDDRARAPERRSEDRPIRDGDMPAMPRPEGQPERAPGGADAQRIAPGGEVRDQQQQQRAPEDFGVFLRHGERVERLSAPSQDRFNELMATAEQKLREGDYFWAERRFERALRFVPGHPMATVGAAHAQLGSGLYLSAALSLRNLFTNQPEMIDVTYAPELLPNRQRLDEAATGLRRRLAGPVDHTAYAFLLAYIGHQIGDRALVEEGLDLMSKSDPENPLTPLLRSIWLAPPQDESKRPGDSPIQK